MTSDNLCDDSDSSLKKFCSIHSFKYDKNKNVPMVVWPIGIRSFALDSYFRGILRSKPMQGEGKMLLSLRVHSTSVPIPDLKLKWGCLSPSVKTKKQKHECH